MILTNFQKILKYCDLVTQITPLIKNCFNWFVWCLPNFMSTVIHMFCIDQIILFQIQFRDCDCFDITFWIWISRLLYIIFFEIHIHKFSSSSLFYFCLLSPWIHVFIHNFLNWIFVLLLCFFLWINTFFMYVCLYMCVIVV